MRSSQDVQDPRAPSRHRHQDRSFLEPRPFREGQAVRVTDYWGEPTATPEWRRPLTERLEMPGGLGIWPDDADLGHY